MLEYERLIAEKLVERYEEHLPRDTAFSQLGFELAKKKAAAPKKIRKAKETTAAENLAKVLGKPLWNDL